MNYYKLPAGVQDVLPEEYYNLSLLSGRRALHSGSAVMGNLFCASEEICGPV